MPFSLNQWSNLTLNEIYHPEYYSILRWILDIEFIFSTFVYLLFSYIIWTQSTSQMGTFKYTIFIQTTLNYFAEFIVFIYCPIFHYPLPMVSFYSHLNFSQSGVALQILVIICVLVACISMFIVSILLRIAATFQIPINILLSRYGYIMFGTPLALFLLSIISYSVVCILLQINADISKTEITKTIPAAYEIYNLLPATFGYDPSVSDSFMLIGAGLIGFWIFFAGILFLILNIIFAIRIKKLAKLLSTDTFAIHKMLYTTLMVQLLITGLLAVSPIIGLFIIFVIQNKNGSFYANLAVPIMCSHILFDAASVLYFVKPYRTFILNRFRKVKELVHSDLTLSTVVILPLTR